MKKHYILPALAVAAMGLFAFQSGNWGVAKQKNLSLHMQSGGGQPALTGAPEEQNCTQCHIGSVLDGSNEIQIQIVDQFFQPATSYTPGSDYTVSVQLASAPPRKGFSATALDGTDAMAGSFTGSGIGGTQDFSAGGRDYVSHTSTSNNSDNTLWAWTWTAPATNVGDVTFYMAANVADSNLANTGDMIYLTTHVIGSTASVDELDVQAESFKAGYSVDANQVVIDFNTLVSDEMYFNLVDMNGRSVYSKDMTKSAIGVNHHVIALPESIKNGMYVVHFFVGNKAMSANILVQK